MSHIAHNARIQHTRGFAARHTIRLIVITGLVTVLLLTESALALPHQAPTDSVKSTIAEVLRILRNDELKKPARATERRQEIEQVVRHRVSYEEMAKRALGLPWTDLTESERSEFVDLFVQLLRDNFAGKIDAYVDEQVVYLSEQQDAHFAVVRSKLTGRRIDTLLDFRLVDRADDWLVYDVVIDGVSIVGNYHAQFTSIIRDHSYADLLRRMKAKALVVKTFETIAGP